MYLGIATTSTNYTRHRLPLPPPPQPRPTTPRPAHAAAHTPRMHHTIIWIHSNRRASEALMTHRAMPVLVDYNASVQAPWYHRAIASNLAVAQQHCLDNRCLFYTPQLGYNAFFVEERIGVADAAAEVGFEVLDRLAGRNEVERCGCREAGAVFA